MKQSLIALDQLINCLVWSDEEGFGRADETLSARAWRLGARHPRTWGAFRTTVDAAFFWEPAHCRQSYESEVARRHLPREYRTIGRGSDA